MSRKFKGFSLAELLISLLVISIVLSAAIPTITKRTSQEREAIWRWTQDNNSTYFGLGAQQAVLVGVQNAPSADLLRYMDDDYKFESHVTIGYHQDSPRYVEPIYINNATFTTSGDKLMLLKKSIPGKSTVDEASHKTTSMGNSHITFYNIENGVDRTENNISYGGRIAVDRHNIAFGIGTLLHQENVLDGTGIGKNVNLWAKNVKVLDKDGDQVIKQFVGENTAIGHYALMANTKGFRNVAVGEKSLTNNREGSFNTAVGFLAANKIGREKGTDPNSYRKTREIYGITVDEIATNGDFASENTAIGSSALTFNTTGFGNTAVGSDALKRNMNGDDNVSLGYFSLGELNRGYGNTALGTNACYTMTEGNYNICIGNAVLSERMQDNFSLAIGSTPTPELRKSTQSHTEYTNMPLISGHTQRVGNKVNPTSKDNKDGHYDKELIVNAKKVEFRTFNGGVVKDPATSEISQHPTFVFTSVPGDVNLGSQTGYGDGKNIGLSGKAYFNLRYEPGKNKSNVVTMQIHSADEQAIIGTFNPSKYNPATKQTAYKDLSFNQILRVDMPFKLIGTENNPLNTDSTMFDKSNIIDPTSVGLIRSKKFKVGLLGEFVERNKFSNSKLPTGTDFADTFELLLNSKVNISRVAAHVFNIDEFGTRIIGNSSALNGVQPFEIILNSNEPNAEDNPNLRISENSTRFNTKNDGYSFLINGGDAFAINNTEVKIFAGKKLYIDDLNYNGGQDDVVAAINDLSSKVNVASDARLKNISGDNTAGLAEINKLEVKNFTYKKDEKKTPHVGVIAQQLQKIFPNSVIKGDDGYFRIRTEEIFYAMVNSIKELCAKIQDLTAKVVGLDKRITELETQNKMLLEQNKAFEKRLEKLEQQAAK